MCSCSRMLNNKGNNERLDVVKVDLNHGKVSIAKNILFYFCWHLQIWIGKFSILTSYMPIPWKIWDLNERFAFKFIFYVPIWIKCSSSYKFVVVHISSFNLAYKFSKANTWPLKSKCTMWPSNIMTFKIEDSITWTNLVGMFIKWICNVLDNDGTCVLRSE